MRRFNPEKELYKIQHGNRYRVMYGVIALLLVIVLGSSYALYQVRYTKRVIYTKVAPFNNDGIKITIYVNGEKQNEAPEKDGNYFYTGLFCNDGDLIKSRWNEESREFEFLETIPEPNKCNAYFVNSSSNDPKLFLKTGTIQEYIVPQDGSYKLEVWGAQGGLTGGFGGYSTGVVKLEKDNKLFVVVGGTTTSYIGGFNGGGNGGTGTGGYPAGNGGGGATHIATATGVLSSLVNNKEAVLIVAGGGGGQIGGGYNGGEGGGLIGTGGYASCLGGRYNEATNEEGYAFGQGQNGSSKPSVSQCGAAGGGGAGGGYYGGYAYPFTGLYSEYTGGGGSGYLSSYLLEDSKYTKGGVRESDGMAIITYLGN